MNNTINNPYAEYKNLSNLSYKIIEVLMSNPKANILWKLLKYNDENAWNKNELTQDEKASLIYPGGEHQENYSVFLDYTMDDAVYDEKTFLRIYPSTIKPTNRTLGICNINFEVLVHGKINHLSNYSTRVDMIIQNLIEVLNGADIGPIGLLFFDSSKSHADGVQIIGMKPYKGKLLTMSVNMG